MTITVKLDPQLEAKLRARLGDNETLSDYIRRALIEKMDADDKVQSPYEAWAGIFDGYGSREADRSMRVKEIVKAKLDAKRRTR